jgi:hypothetical protein
LLCAEDRVVATAGSIEADFDKVQATAPGDAVEVTSGHGAATDGDVDEADIAGGGWVGFGIDNCASGWSLTDRHLEAHCLVGDVVA